VSEVIQQVDWFMPPAGILDGTHHEIALGYVERKIADELHVAVNPLYGHAENPIRVMQELEVSQSESLAHLLGLKYRLLNTDEQLANELTEAVKQEVVELYVGVRGIVTGEAHLYFARRKAILHLWEIAHEGIKAQ
jgi:RecB family endonuclease NucS